MTTLVVCHGDYHECQVRKIINLDPAHTMWSRPFAPLMGHRFSRIILFVPYYESKLQREALANWVKELQLKLEPDGELIIL